MIDNTNNDTINVRELEKLTKANWFLWRAKVFWNLGVFGEAGEELKNQTRNINYEAFPNKTQSVQEVFTMDDGRVMAFSRPWNMQDTVLYNEKEKEFRAKKNKLSQDRAKLMAYIINHIDSEVLQDLSNNPAVPNLQATNDVVGFWQTLHETVQQVTGQDPTVSFYALTQRNPQTNILTPLSEFLLIFNGLRDLCAPVGGINPISDAVAVDKLLGAIDFTRYKEYIINVQGNKPGYAKLQTDLMGIEKTLAKHEVANDTAHAYYSLGNKSTSSPYYRTMVPGSAGRQPRYGVVSSSRSPYKGASSTRDTSSTRTAHKDMRNTVCHNCGGLGHISIDCKLPKYICGVCEEEGHREWFCGKFQKPPGYARKRSRLGSPTRTGSTLVRPRVNYLQDEFHEAAEDEHSVSYLNCRFRPNEELPDGPDFEEALFARPSYDTHNRDERIKNYEKGPDDYPYSSNE